MKKTPEAIAAYESDKLESLGEWGNLFFASRKYTKEEVSKITAAQFQSVYPTAEQVISASDEIDEIPGVAWGLWRKAAEVLVDEKNHTASYSFGRWEKNGADRIYIYGWIGSEDGGKIWIERQEVKNSFDSDWKLCHKGIEMGVFSTSFGRKPWEQVLHDALTSRGADLGVTFDEIAAMCGGA